MTVPDARKMRHASKKMDNPGFQADCDCRPGLRELLVGMDAGMPLRSKEAPLPTVSALVAQQAGAATDARLSKRHGLRPAWKLSFEGSGPVAGCGWASITIAALLVAALVSLALAAVVLYFSAETVSRPGGPVPATVTADVVAGEFRITNEEFLPTLRESDSTDFKQLSSQICQQLDILFLASALGSRYKSSRVVSFAPGLRVSTLVFLTAPPGEAASLVGVEFLRGLRHHRGRKWLGAFAVDVQSIAFQVISESAEVVDTIDGVPTVVLLARWSPWSPWSDCTEARTQSRTRRCLDQFERPLQVDACMAQGEGGDVEARDCGSASVVEAASVFEEQVLDQTLPLTRHCDECLPEEVCVALGSEQVPVCRQPKDSADPTGCGGFCIVQLERCQKLDVDAFRCVDDTYCLPNEWRCANHLCIPQIKRCDGHLNCYDRTDEYDCDCDLNTHFHCGNETSCLPLKNRCDGVINCWDGSDELNCTIACPDESQFTCTDGQCISRSQFCDGFTDCIDKSDEPFGCEGECKGQEWKCKNGRCIRKEEVCDARDNCGDMSDESNCPPSEQH